MKDKKYEYQVFKLVESLVEKINFGVYENTDNYNFDLLKVVSFIGEWSEEKDKLLNELFATRFNYKLNKEYRGILMSLYAKEIDNKKVLYVVLNVEGFA